MFVIPYHATIFEEARALVQRTPRPEICRAPTLVPRALCDLNIPE
jgi:hypothetical protein